MSPPSDAWKAWGAAEAAADLRLGGLLSAHFNEKVVLFFRFPLSLFFSRLVLGWLNSCPPLFTYLAASVCPQRTIIASLLLSQDDCSRAHIFPQIFDQILSFPVDSQTQERV